ncbi:sugar-phosphatase [Lacticaseibacillus parakribbianus]|uniref:sugar-phosphatase n=1 Tax=Lacticaseibacillus parakribbianus TaxID=2970927 RepID=UPI0021CB11CC|nr:sugar-phosphatase [Lacticaseibacillus parakribbianus]
MAIQLVAIDLDGTLLNDNHDLDQVTIDAVKAAAAQGVRVVLCSGRPLSGIAPLFAPLGLGRPDDYVIAYNGALVQNAASGAVIDAHTLSLADFKRLAAFASTQHVHIQALDREHLYTPNADVSRFTVRESYLLHVPLFYRPLAAFAPEKRFVKVMLIDEPELLAGAKQALPSDYFDVYYIVNSEPFFLEVLPPAVSKGNAVATLAAHLGIPMADVMAIGDQANDVPMIAAAGLGVAMGNGIEAAKAAADAVTGTNAAGGVAQALRRFVLK